MLSLAIHISILLAISINEVFSEKTYEVVNVVPISFDTKVESNIVGVKPVKGELNGGAFQNKSSVPGGKRSTGAPEGGGASIKKLENEGAGETVVSMKKGSSPSKLVKSFSTGRGVGKVELSVELPNRKGKELPSISSSKLVPYLIRVRDTIMKNWKVPYFTSVPGKRQTTVVLTLRNDGTVDELTVEKLSPDITFNRSAISAIYSVKSFGRFPKGVKEKKVRLKVKFEVK